MSERALLALGLLMLIVLPGPAVARPATRETESLARRLCDALQALPEARRSSCRGTAAAAGGLAEVCARELGRALRDRTLALDPADVDRCVADSERALAGCDWVTPRAPRAPATCDGILRGRVAAGGRCRSALECGDGLACRGHGPGVPGTCAPPLARGAPCRGVPDALETYTRQSGGAARHPECAGLCLLGRCAESDRAVVP